jgi:hypothetical protein
MSVLPEVNPHRRSLPFSTFLEYEKLKGALGYREGRPGWRVDAWMCYKSAFLYGFFLKSSGVTQEIVTLVAGG